MEKTPLELAQVAFTEWLVLVDGLLETAQLKHDEALGALRNGDTKAFGDALGVSIGHIDKARSEIKAGLEGGGLMRSNGVMNEPKAD
jgi:hypothetical protein